MSSPSSPAGPDPRRDEVHWAGPGHRARIAAAVLAIVLAALTMLIVNRAWKRAPHPHAAPPRAVEVRIVPSPRTAASLPSR